jgi:hypothetical protein
LTILLELTGLYAPLARDSSITQFALTVDVAVVPYGLDDHRRLLTDILDSLLPACLVATIS